MLSIRVIFLTGRYNATEVLQNTSLEDVEWPPHPTRLFAALVKVLYEQLDNRSDCRAALEWLSEQGAPDIGGPLEVNRQDPAEFYCPRVNALFPPTPASLYQAQMILRQLHEESSPELEAQLRTVLKAEPERALASFLGEARKSNPPWLWASKRARTFPSGSLPRSKEDSCVEYSWLVEADPKTFAALTELCRRLPYLGRSSSPVQVLVSTKRHQAPTLVPSEEGGVVQCRVPSPGLIARLDEAFAKHLGSGPRTTPSELCWYDVPRPRALAKSCMGEDWILLQHVEGKPFFGRNLWPMAKALRSELFRSMQPNPLPEILSGHDPEQFALPAKNPHLAIVGLPFVGDHGTGRIMGFALILPRSGQTPSARMRLQQATDQDLQVHGRVFRKVESSPKGTLAPWRWCRSSTTWQTVTPVVLDRNPGKLWGPGSTGEHARAERNATQILRASCDYMGLPEPETITFHTGSMIQGVEPSRNRYWALPVSTGLPRVMTHAVIQFPVSVRGPIMLGALRFYGMGLFSPV